ncbi:polyprenyl synthetase family protein [Streptomyces sp. NPDC018045]|uniref:polyprenyl synthetase family protein n=1 Tax=Streptomyces sp. NPDC018045 TaxID=3365037 RepID=UPI0037AFCC18
MDTSDIVTGRPTADVNRALAIIRYKTAKYTIERPLHGGATLAGADAASLRALSAYAVPLSEAFQLHDDLLGVYGAPERTGKPSLDDLRDGKHTALIALPLQSAHHSQADQLSRYLGCPSLTEGRAPHHHR